MIIQKLTRSIPSQLIKMTLVSSLVLSQASLAIASSTTPNDPYFSKQTALSLSSARDNSIKNAWNITTDASPVVVAVIDTGADLSHADLQENLWINANEIPNNGIDDDGNGYADDVNGYDFFNRDGNPEDQWGHGTIVSGIIGAVGNNGIGTTGVAWSIQLMELKVFGRPSDDGLGHDEEFAEAVRYAVHNGAKVINASWTMSSSFRGDEIPSLKAAIQEARSQGVLVIAAAGNDGEDLDANPVYPAAYHLGNVISVAALKEGRNELLENSNYGAENVTVAIDGEGILGPYLRNTYATLTGTSAATGLVTGISSLILSQRPDFSPDQVREVIIGSSHPSEELEGLVASQGVVDSHASLLSASMMKSQTEGEADPVLDESNENSGFAAPVSGGCSLIF